MCNYNFPLVHGTIGSRTKPFPKCTGDFSDSGYYLLHEIFLCFRSKLQEELDGFKLSEVLEQLKTCPSGLDPMLAMTLR